MNKIFGDNAALQFLGMHAEKIVLGLAGLLVLAFLYLGSSQQGLTDDPAELQRQTASAQQKMNDPNAWEQFKADRDLPLKEPGERGAGRIDPATYVTDKPLDPPTIPLSIRRKDPSYFPPVELQVKGGDGPIAMFVNPALPPPPAPQQNPENPPQPVPDWFRLKIPGHRPTNGSELKGTYFVSLTAAVPYRQQVEEYDFAFKQAMGYDSVRDTPNYVYYIVQRAEVATPDEQPAWPEQWSAKTNPKVVTFYSWNAEAECAKWDQPVQEIVDAKYLDPKLTMQPLPLLLRDLNSYLMHPRVERIKPAGSDHPDPALEGPPMPQDPLGPIEDPAAGPPGPKPPMNPMAPGVRPNPMGPNRAPPPPPRGGHGPGPRVGGPGMENRRRPDGMGGPGGNANEPPPEFKLFRFFDTSVTPGRLYKYRVQFWIEDPNDPQQAPPAAAGQPAPAGRDAGNFPPAPLDAVLNDDVIERRKAKRLAQKPGAKHIYWRETKWSEASPAVGLPSNQTLLAGAVTQRGENDAWRHLEPSGKVAARIFDLAALIPGFETVVPPVKGPRDIAGELEVYRSSVINFEATGAALEPIKLEIEKYKKYPFVTQATVLDVRGGEKVPAAAGKSKDSIDGIGEMLLMDASGRLIVRSEADDAEEYKDSLLKFEKTGPVLNGGGDRPFNIPGVPGVEIPGGFRQPPPAVRPRS